VKVAVNDPDIIRRTWFGTISLCDKDDVFELLGDICCLADELTAVRPDDIGTTIYVFSHYALNIGHCDVFRERYLNSQLALDSLQRKITERVVICIGDRPRKNCCKFVRFGSSRGGGNSRGRGGGS
jgi:hypothetical protein